MIDRNNYIFDQVHTNLGSKVKFPSRTFQATPSEFPTFFMNVIGNDSIADDLSNNENAINSTIEFTVYAKGTSRLATCESIMSNIDDTMRGFGYRRSFGPQQITNAADTTICRLIARYNRIIANGDTL